MGVYEDEMKRYQQILAARQAQAIYQLGNLFGPNVSSGMVSYVPFSSADVFTRPLLDKELIDKLKQAEPRKVTARVPDGIIPITAWRGWGVVGDAQLRLAGLGKSVTWEPKKKLEARCSNNGTHPAPQANCTCGVWAFKSLDIMVKAAQSYSPKVIGMVSLWGRIIETENGFRAQHAYPKELWLLDSSLEELGRVYDVPIRTAG